MKFTQIFSAVLLSAESARSDIEVPLTKSNANVSRDWSLIENPNIENAVRFDKEEVTKHAIHTIPPVPVDLINN